MITAPNVFICWENRLVSSFQRQNIFLNDISGLPQNHVGWQVDRKEEAVGASEQRIGGGEVFMKGKRERMRKPV